MSFAESKMNFNTHLLTSAQYPTIIFIGKKIYKLYTMRIFIRKVLKKGKLFQVYYHNEAYDFPHPNRCEKSPPGEKIPHLNFNLIKNTS